MIHRMIDLVVAGLTLTGLSVKKRCVFAVWRAGVG
jgi:hypothetical protein